MVNVGSSKIGHGGVEVKKAEEESDDDEITVKIGDKDIALDDITDEMIEKMTPEEHDAYMKAYQEAFSHLY